MGFQKRIEEQIVDVISKWDDKNIYAISFLLVYDCSANYKGVNNFPELSIGYNTEEHCGSVDLLSEERWNYAFWSQNNTIILDSENTEMSDCLLEWYKEKKISNVGIELEEDMYDDDMNYVGNGPGGYIELLNLISDIARKIQSNGYIKKRFGTIPIIVHDLEYSWYVYDATKNANPNDEAKTFLDYYHKMLFDA